nr:MAG: replication associated protein [Cressdnaviricota sp.]
MAQKTSRNWWVMKWFDTEDDAMPWVPPNKPKLKYCCWRVHKCPTTQRIHIHILYQFATVCRFSSLESKGYNNIKWVAQEDMAKKRGYCIDDNHKKDGTPKGVLGPFQEIGEWREQYDKKAAKNDVANLALSSTTVEEGMSIIKAARPWDFILYGETIERNLRRNKPFITVPKYALDTFIREPIAFEEKSVLLWGATNTGKTAYALAHFKNPLFLSGSIDRLRQFNTTYDGIVFDELSVHHWPAESVIHLLDYEYPRDIRTRYSDAHIPAGTRKIFTHNTRNPFYKEDIPEEQKLAIERRLLRIEIEGKLYK